MKLFISIFILCVLIFSFLLMFYFCKVALLNCSVISLFHDMKCKETHTDYSESEADVDKFFKGSPYKGNYIKYLDFVCKQTSDFIKRNELLKLVNKTVIFDLDDTLIYTKEAPLNNLYKPLKPVLKMALLAKKLKYVIIIITARPPESIEIIKENLKLIGLEVDAIFTSQYWGQDPRFKSIMRKNLEYINSDKLKTISTKELLEMKCKRIPGLLDLKIVLSVGDKWHDVDNSKNILGLKLPEDGDMNAYFIFNDNIRRIE